MTASADAPPTRRSSRVHWSPVARLVRSTLEHALDEAEARAPGAVAALDAGCGRVSHLEPFRGRIGRLVGVDVHPLAAPLPHLDEFVIADLCGSEFLAATSAA